MTKNAALAPVPMVAKDGSPVRKGQIRPPVRAAIALICHEGTSIADAAQRVGMARESLSRALQRPHVRAFQAEVKRAWRESKSYQAAVRIDELGSGAESEKVRLEANRTLLQMAGELHPEAGDQKREFPQLIQFIRHETHETHVHGADEPRRVTALVETSPGVWELPRQEGE